MTIHIQNRHREPSEATSLCKHLFYILLLTLMPGQNPISAQVPDRVEIATSGRTRALMVLVRFKDDATIGEPCLDFRGWPLYADSTRLPEFAHNLLSPSPDPPFADSSLTAYFYEQSNHQFTLYGDVYPQVIVTDQARTWYRGERGYGYLTREILDKMDTDIDFRDYDTNPTDGVVDQLFIVVRNEPGVGFTGVANLYGADAVRGRPPVRLIYDGILVNWERSGSYIIHDRPGHILTQPYYVRLLAHEFGHHLWNDNGYFPAHLPAITSNNIPADNPDALGYVLMAGRGGGRDVGGDLLISAPERDLLGWGRPVTLNLSQMPDTAIVLGDLYATGRYLKLVLAEQNADFKPPVLYVSNRQRIGPFDRLRTHQKQGCTTYEMGLLRTTGLLVQLVRTDLRSIQVDVLPADNTLSISTENQVYEGDLFKPETMTQLTPWTRPHTGRPNGSASWAALDQIRYTDNGQGEMAFDLYNDFRSHPIIRADSWIGPETSGYRFTTPFMVESGVELHLEQTRLYMADDLHLESGSRVNIDPEAELIVDAKRRLRLDRDAVLVVSGTLDARGDIDRAPGSRIVIQPGGRLKTTQGLTVAFQEIEIDEIE